VTGQDFDSGLTGQASAHVPDLATGAHVPVELPPSGSVTVTLSGLGGAPASPQRVALSSRGLAFDRDGYFGESSSFTFERVALGGFHVQAADTSGVRGSATGALAGAGDSTTVPIELPETTWLEGQVFGAQSGYVDVHARSLEHDGPLGPTVAYATAESYYGVWVPVGSVRVGAVEYDANPPAAGLAEGVVGPPSDVVATIDVTLGNATLLTANLAGADGFLYDPTCDGTLSSGGGAYSSAYSVGLAGRSFPSWPCFPAAAEEGGRELVIGPRDVTGIRMTRQVYVPPAGGFARYLELLTNPDAATVTVPVSVEGYLTSYESTRIVASPASTGRRYALTDSSECCRPVLGHVFAGAGGRVGVASTRFDDGSGYFSYRWTVTIGPGETVALLHFAVQRDRLDTAGATQQAEALANLTDPRALDGMTPLERSQVVNFDVP
jgi:hypothetical protein